jgi:cytochrome c oxidase subunit II
MTLIKGRVVFALVMGLAVYSYASRAYAGATGEVVKITASKFHFTPDHIILVKGQPVTLQLTSNDTTHGFLIRALRIDTDIKPGTVTRITVTPQTAGTFKAICDHYCGLGHGGMKMTVTVQEAAARVSPERVLTAFYKLSR